MRTYVLGAGASDGLYPLGGGLLQEIVKYIRSRERCAYESDYMKKWPGVFECLETNPDSLLRAAYRSGNIERVFTVLDLAEVLRKPDGESADSELEKYKDIRQVLLLATVAYFEDKHAKDQMHFGDRAWDNLKTFGEKLGDHDVVITFNYDSTIERVLWQEEKWSPTDGYGINLAFQRSRSDPTEVPLKPSKVKVFHLHGAIGWYRNPHTKAVTPTLEPDIALDPIFLKHLRIPAVDKSLLDRPPAACPRQDDDPFQDDYKVLLHPSFLKKYGGEDIGNDIFIRQWKMASDALRAADEVTIIGYSLPPEDSAVWTLLLTSCSPEKTVIVNPCSSVMLRYEMLLNLPRRRPLQNFESWLFGSSGAPGIHVDV